MRSVDRPGLQNRRVAGNPVTGGFDPHSLPPGAREQRCFPLEQQSILLHLRGTKKPEKLLDNAFAGGAYCCVVV